MVVDTSALLAYLQGEAGGQVVQEVLAGGSVLLSSVNRMELKGKLVGSGGFTPYEVETRLNVLSHLLTVVDFDLKQSDVAAFYYARRHPYNLSLGGCACLALAETRGLAVLTAEKGWGKIPDLPFAVRLIR